MQNGYALGTAEGLAAIGEVLHGAGEELRDTLRGNLAYRPAPQCRGHRRRRGGAPTGLAGLLLGAPCRVFASAVAAVGAVRPSVLEAIYEATLLAAAEQAGRDGSNTVLLTTVGGGAFGNEPSWILDAIERALGVVENAGLDVRIVGHREISPAIGQIIDRWAGGARQDDR